jgi:enoyl-CoA hydratase/carnithine racemase
VDTTPHGRLPAGKVVVVTAGAVVDVVVVDTVGSAWCAGGDVQAAATMLMRPTAAVIHRLGTMCTTDRGGTRSAYGRLGPLPRQVG